MAEALTLMAVHAHPDDESISTGGVLARYAEEGLRTVPVLQEVAWAAVRTKKSYYRALYHRLKGRRGPKKDS